MKKMNKQRFYSKGKTIWLFEYKWTDDYHYNLGLEEMTEHFIGTKEEFKEYCKNYEEGDGFSAWQIKKRHCTEEEYNLFLNIAYS